MNHIPAEIPSQEYYHEPIMLSEVLTLIAEHSTHTHILDGTLGLGGYSQAILDAFPESHVLGIDRDTQALEHSRKRLELYGERFRAIHANFSTLQDISGDFDAYVFDLGVSNMQLSRPERGFSFSQDGALDMRMNPNGQEMTAAELCKYLHISELTKIFRDYGEERHAHQIAVAIKNSKIPIETTGDLVKLIRDTLPQPVQRKMGTHPARRIFQALRIYVNNETGELEALLRALHEVKNKAVIIFVSYHSLEDRQIKIAFREWHREGKGEILTKHPMTPTDEELHRNYKARSAKLRAFVLV